MTFKEKCKLVAIHGAINDAMGDTDPDCGDMTDGEIRSEYPLLWAAMYLAKMIGAGPWDKYTAGYSLSPTRKQDCICYNCGTAPHNNGDGDCACEQNPWFDVDRCKPCRHNLGCDVARNPHLYPRDSSVWRILPPQG